VWERPIYWAVTCREDRLLGLQDYLQLEGLSLRLVPIKTKSSMNQYGIVGAGRVDTDIAYKNIMEKWAWGNFDKERLFIDRSYQPSLQTMRVAIIRIGRQMIVEGKKDKAVSLVDKYFEVFPAYNFPYDQFSAFLADIYFRAGANDKAAAKVREIAKTMEQQLKFHESLSPEFQKAYQQDYQYTLSTVQTLLNIAEDMKDTALSKELDDMFTPYMPQAPGMPGLPQ
jgi:tetratricopeptide (TPR) repeat protein